MTQRRSLEEMSHAELEKLLDREISFAVRAGAARQIGSDRIPCFTCGTRRPWRTLDAGHYIGRTNRGVRWDPRDIRPQCRLCNTARDGERAKFRAHLVRELGEAEVENLERTAGAWAGERRTKVWLIEEIRAWRKKNASLRQAME